MPAATPAPHTLCPSPLPFYAAASPRLAPHTPPLDASLDALLDSSAANLSALHASLHSFTLSLLQPTR